MNNNSKIYRLNPSEMKSIQSVPPTREEYKYSHRFKCGNGLFVECHTNCNGNWEALSEGPVSHGYVTAIRCNEYIHSCEPDNPVRFAGSQYECNPSTWPGNSEGSGTEEGSGTGGGSGTFFNLGDDASAEDIKLL